MPPEATVEQVNQLAANVRELSENVKEQTRSNVQLSQDLTQTTTMLRGHIQEQRSRNERIDRLIDKHTEEIGNLQRFQTRAEATIPNKLIDGDEINQRLEKHDTDISGIGKTIAKGLGAIAVVAAAGPIIVTIVMKLIWG